MSGQPELLPRHKKPRDLLGPFFFTRTPFAKHLEVDGDAAFNRNLAAQSVRFEMANQTKARPEPCPKVKSVWIPRQSTGYEVLSL
jgi:hypothetical protein